MFHPSSFQKVRTWDKIKNLELWLNNELPAFIEGSDAKSIDAIGNENEINGDTQTPDENPGPLHISHDEDEDEIPEV